MSVSSEFICDVVRVAEVVKHPNADKLDVVRVEGFFGDIIASRGEWVPGQLAVHIGPDAMVPLDDSRFEFLKGRLDIKPGESHYRLKMAKLRGLVSHGILIPVPPNLHNLDVGDSLASELGVLKYETPAERRLRQSEVVQENTDGPFVRFLKRFNFIERARDSRLREVRRKIPDYSVVSLRKVPDYFTEGELVEVTEKIHGANIRFGLIDGVPFIGSHHSVKSDHRPWWQKLLGINRPKKNHWYTSDIWTDWVTRNVDFKNLPDNTVFYGEIYGKGVQDLEYNLKTTHVHIYDVWFVDEQKWADSNGKLYLRAVTGLDHAPFIHAAVPYSKDLWKLADGKSSIADHLKEGIVIKSLDGKKRAKVVSDAYKMR
jgi:tRNA-binding EMAP/Myf-like protein